MYRDNGYQAVNQNVYSLQKMIGDLLKSGWVLFIYLGKTERNPTIRYDKHDYCVVKKDFLTKI